MEIDIRKCYESAVAVARKAGVVIADGFRKTKKIEQKTSPRDLVTETDKAVEELVIEELRTAYPEHTFIGEESVAAGAKCELTDAPTWIIDPVDGTMNFVHCFPYTCISIGLWVNKEARLGVVYNPILDQMFTAKKGEGAFLNGERIKVSGQKDLAKALVVTELGYRPEEWKMKIVSANVEKMIQRCHGGRAVGSAVLDMCLLASGSVDGYFEIGLHSWDVAAAVVIVTEAAGVVMDVDGGPHDVMNRRVLCAASPELAQQMVELLQVYEEDRD